MQKASYLRIYYINGGLPMIHQTVNHNHFTHYTDISNNKRTVRHSVVPECENTKELEAKIVDEIYRVFMNKAI